MLLHLFLLLHIPFKKYMILILISFLVSCTYKTNHVDIGLFSEKLVTAVIIEPENGKYEIRNDSSKLLTIQENEAIFAILDNGRIRISTSSQFIGIFKKIYIKEKLQNSSDFGKNIFRIKCLQPELEERSYCNNITLVGESNRLKIVNNVDISKYIAGVIECEGGPNAPLEFYKAQAIMARTFIKANQKRHHKDGYQLCDNVHCQAYLHKSYNPQARKATNETYNIIIMDTTGKPLVSAFHANCGGETANSKMFWAKPKYYLKGIVDPWCINTHQANWTKTIGINEWRIYLINNGININNNYSGFNFSQVKRKSHYRLAGDSLPLTKIRSDWDLKSTFFNITQQGTFLILNGKGFGHGIGMCQEGGISMARNKKTYKEILNFYFNNTKLVRIKDNATTNVSGDTDSFIKEVLNSEE